MRGFEARIGGVPVEPAVASHFEWIDRARGIARLRTAEGDLELVVEGRGPSEWLVTIAGRRIAVSIQTWRERMLAEAEGSARAHAGPVEIRATLPGLVVAVGAEAGSEVSEGQPLITIEAMKMQNEVRAPRDGTVAEVLVAPGQTVATGTPLLRIG